MADFTIDICWDHLSTERMLLRLAFWVAGAEVKEGTASSGLSCAEHKIIMQLLVLDVLFKKSQCTIQNSRELCDRGRIQFQLHQSIHFHSKVKKKKENVF